MKKLIILLCILLIAPFADAATLYVRQGATGSANGADWTNAYTALPSTLVRGNTYYIADGSYSGRTFSTAATGSTPIYIKKATTADHGIETGWSSGYGDGQAIFTSGLTFSTDYWVLDGQTRTNKSSGHGFRINAGSYKGIVFTGRSNLTFKYVEIVGGGDDGNGPNNDLMYSTSPSSNINIQYCYLRDSGRTHILSRGGSTWLVEYNYFRKNESVGDEHSESWSCGTTSYVTLRYNQFEDCEGTGLIVSLDSPTGATNWDIYGNIFGPSANSNYGNGLITTDSESVFNNVKFYNNVIYGISGNAISCAVAPGGGGTGTGWQSYNNMVVSNTCTSFSFSGTHDYNYFYNNSFTSPTETNRQIGTGNLFTNAAAGDFTLTGATARGVTLIGFATDPLNNTRGADGTWDRGAYEFGGTDITFPTVSTRTIGTSGVLLTLVFNESVTSATSGNGGFAISPSGGAANLTYSSGSGTEILIYTISRPIQYNETVTVSYVKPAPPVVEDLAGNDLDAFSNSAVTNNSTLGSGGGDTTAPVVLALTPSGAIPYATTFVLGGTTDESATCRADTSKSLYDDMVYPLSAAGNVHTVTLPGVASTNFVYYLRCKDTSGNITAAQTINFSMGAPFVQGNIITFTGTGSLNLQTKEGTLTFKLKTE